MIFRSQRKKQTIPSEELSNKTSAALAKGILRLQHSFARKMGSLDRRLTLKQRKWIYSLAAILFLGWHASQLATFWQARSKLTPPGTIVTTKDIALPDSLSNRRPNTNLKDIDSSTQKPIQ
ncbi:hypothetical protein [Paraflavitalea sp. CAU 1676]|uniref:hypothetical protein n=1 Tax=Paraflavitalea sp. CAU 1676 TaxID=3032598 RepID=UPI0023DC93CB|nr:hypothetical protein [Paraflavitalea sp. CAU 1676]MDF2191372.1 hypothetical protein [Paraflavitalea sp. CAU 1676]